MNCVAVSMLTRLSLHVLVQRFCPSGVLECPVPTASRMAN